MTRPRYENEETRRKEAAVATRIAEVSGLKLTKMPISYGLDYLVYSPETGKPVRVIEIKCRNNDSTRYPTFMVALKKFQHARSLSELLNVPAVIFVEFLDDILIHDLVFHDYMYIQHGGRVDRWDEADQEPMVHIPVEKMTSWKALFGDA